MRGPRHTTSPFGRPVRSSPMSGEPQRETIGAPGSVSGRVPMFPLSKRSREGGAAIENRPGVAAAVALPRRFPLFAPEGALKNAPGAPSSVPQAEEGAARSPCVARPSRTNALLSSDARSH